MNQLTNYLPTEALRRRNAGHHMEPLSAQDELSARGGRVITSAKVVYITDSDGNQYLDAMAGLWCVNIGYGRSELADVAARQMRELPYYNTFFQTTHVPVIELS